MDTPRVGDLAVVVRSCCGMNLGRVFRVTLIEDGLLICALSGHTGCHKLHATRLASGDRICVPLSWTRRVPPLDELNKIEREADETLERLHRDVQRACDVLNGDA